MAAAGCAKVTELVKCHKQVPLSSLYILFLSAIAVFSGTALSYLQLKIPQTYHNFHIYFRFFLPCSKIAQKKSSKIMIINFFYGDMQPINLFFDMYTVYNKLIKGNVHGRYFSREI